MSSCCGQYARIPLAQVDIGDISSEPGPYCMSYGYDGKGLRRSIERIGLVNPPCVVAKRAGGFETVSGYRRYLAARSLGWERILCRDLSDLQMTTLDLLLLNLHENLCTRSLNEIEKAMVLKRLSACVPQEQIMKDYMPLLGLRPHQPLLRTFLLLDDVEEPVRAGIAKGKISSQAAELLLGLDAESRLAVHSCAMKLNLNSNYQRQIIELLIEISEIETATILEILSRDPLTEILKKEPENAPQKAKAFLEALRAMRNPRVADAELRFQHQLSSIHLPPDVKIIHSPFFEDSSFRLEVLFKDGRALKDKMLQISETDGIEKIQPPWVIRDDEQIQHRTDHR